MSILPLACSETVDPPPAPPFSTANGVHEIMEHVLDPAAEAVWSAAGYEITEAGEKELWPTTDAGWAAVENGAVTVAESANLLMLPGRVPRGEADWIRHAQQLAKAGAAAAKAAEARDKARVFDAGGEIYQACVACHRQYVTPD